MPLAIDMLQTPQHDIGAAVLSHPLFRGLAGELQSRVIEGATIREIDSQHLVFHQDKQASELFLVLDGAVDVEIPALVGAPALIQTLGPGSALGWSWMFAPHRWHFDARAAVPTTLLCVDARALRDYCDAHPAQGYELVKRVAAMMMERLDAARQRVIRLYDNPPR